MKARVLAIAAAIASGVSATNQYHARRHAHQALHVERDYLTTGSAPEATCGCTTIYTTITGEGTLIHNKPTPKPTTSTSSYTPPVVPTPLATTCPTPGVYTIPATTVTLTESTTVCAATSTYVPSGTHTVGGVTTVVETETTVVCPYATVSTSSGVVTSTILTTTYVCPSAGTYTIVPPLTTSCSTSSVWVYPIPASYPAGTYTQKEVVTTVTETDYVVFCPFTSPTPTPTYVAPPPAKTTYAAAPPPPKSSSPPSSGHSHSGGVGSSSPPPPSGGSSYGGGLGSSGDQWALTYTPYENSGNCKSEGAILADIALIKLKGFKTVRVYSTDCSTLEYVGSACEISGLKLILGVYISDTGISGAQDQVTAIVSWAEWELVELVVFGNEAVFNGYCTASELAGFISSSKSSLKSAGYSGPSTTTEPVDIWQASVGALCEAVDVVGANAHPFFNAGTSASEAGSFISGQLDIIDSLCPGKSGYIMETGWPSNGQCNGNACPGAAEQATAVAGIKAAVGGKACMFSFENDLWKPLGSFDCEQSWGLIDLYPSL